MPLPQSSSSTKTGEEPKKEGRYQKRNRIHFCVPGAPWCLHCLVASRSSVRLAYSIGTTKNPQGSERVSQWTNERERETRREWEKKERALESDSKELRPHREQTVRWDDCRSERKPGSSDTKWIFMSTEPSMHHIVSYRHTIGLTSWHTCGVNEVCYTGPRMGQLNILRVQYGYHRCSTNQHGMYKNG